MTQADNPKRGPVLAWHFLADNRKLRDGSAPSEPGGIETFDGHLAMCASGLHASRRAIDAVKYAPGPIVRRVECSGDIEEQDDKLVCRSRQILWELDATNVLHEFACRCAEDALALVERPDPRSLAAIEAKRAWLRGDATDKELAAARDAARDAAWAAARDAAGAAARDAARDAARAAARDAAGAAAMNAQNKRLTAMLAAAHKKGAGHD